MKLKLAALTSLTLSLLSSTLFAHSVIQNHEPSIAPMLSKAMPAVVNISAEAKLPQYLLAQIPSNIPKDQLPKPLRVGSGVIFSANKGLIITNDHVVDNSKAIVVTLKDGRRFRANVVASAKDYDLAILHIRANHLTSMPFANSDHLRVGDFVAAIGSPFGLKQTVTSGVISALDRNRQTEHGFRDFIQTDAPINPGNSGGALVDMQGDLAGINTAILSNSDSNIGIGFAIPSNMVKAVITQLLQYGKVERGMLGVMAQNLSPDLQQALNLKNDQGAIITQLVPHSPAELAGLKPRDIILGIDNEKVESADQLRNDVSLLRPGTRIDVHFIRDHKEQALAVEIGNPKALLSQQSQPFIDGVTLRNFNQIGPDGLHVVGAQIVDATDLSNATLDGLQPGDVITSIGNTAVTSAKQVKQIIQTTKKDSLLITFSRQHIKLFAVLQR